MRRVLLIAMVGCASVGSPVEPPPAPRKPPPRSTVLVRTERRPPVGARWHEHDTITETEARGSEHHDRTQVLDADVSVVAQAPEREVYNVVIRQHTSTHDGTWAPGPDRTFEPGTALRVERSQSDCDITRDGKPVGDYDHVHFTNLFECRWPAPGQGDDDILVLSVPHRVGETWPIDRERLRQRDFSEATYTDDDVTLERISNVGGIQTCVLHARFHETHEVGGVPIVRSVTHTYVAPLDPRLPILRDDKAIRQTRGEIEDTYHVTRERTPR